MLLSGNDRFILKADVHNLLNKKLNILQLAPFRLIK